MRVVFMGTPDFAVATLEAVIEAGHEVVAVVTQPDKPKGRSRELAMSPVKECALKHNIEVLQPKKAREESFVETLRQYRADVIVVVAFGQILPESILNMPEYGCINVHASLLPEYRGASPIQWAVIDGCEYSGVTTMQMDAGIDTGDILLVEKVKLDKKETGGSLFDRLSTVGAGLLVKTLEAAEKGELKPVKQDNSRATHVSMISKAFGEMDFNRPAAELERLIRGLNPWPSTYTMLNGKTFKIWDADVCSDMDKAAVAGAVTKSDKNQLVVKCGEDSLLLKEVQLEGKKRMKIEDFLRGSTVEEGIVLGRKEDD